MESLRVREGLDSEFAYLHYYCTGLRSSIMTDTFNTFHPIFLRMTRSSKAFLLTRVNLPAHCVASLPIVFFHVALGGAQRLVLGTHPQTGTYVCLLGR